MKFYKFASKIALTILMVSMFLSSSAQLTHASVSQRYVVAFKDDVSIENMHTVLENQNLHVSRYFDEMGLAIIVTDNEQSVKSLSQSSQIEAVTIENKMPVPNLNINQEPITPAPAPTDPIYVNNQWHIRRTLADQVWTMGKTASHNTIVGVVDTGIASNHPDLSGNIVHQACFNSTNTPCNPYPQFPSNMGGSHGTVVAGIIGSAINNVGVVGVAPSVGIANLNVSEVGPSGVPTVFDSSIWTAIKYAADQNIDVLNFSFGEVLQRPLSRDDRQRVKNWRRVVKYANDKGVTMVAAAGNEGVDLNDPEIQTVPCELPHMICVSATNIRPQPIYPQPGTVDQATFYTSFGDEVVDLAAPGGDCGGPDLQTCLTTPDPRYFVWTTTVAANALCAATQSCPVSYTATIGTSVSTPHVAGVAALMIDAYKQNTGKDLKPNRVENILTQTAQPLPNYPQLGAGIVNAKAAVDKVLQLN